MDLDTTYSLIAIALRAGRRRRGYALSLVPQAERFAGAAPFVDNDERDVAHVDADWQGEGRWIEGIWRVWDEKLCCWVRP